MTHRVRIAGDTWKVRLDRSDETPGVNALVFLCASNTQRPYRVVPIGEEDARRDPSALSDRRLRELFESSQVMDFVRNPDAV